MTQTKLKLKIFRLLVKISILNIISTKNKELSLLDFITKNYLF